MSAKLVQGYEVVIGFETHAQLSTQSKIFSRAPTAFGAEPNTQACAVDLALPGTLPVMNVGAVERAMSALLTPAREGSPGPGEITTRQGSLAMSSSTVCASLSTTRTRTELPATAPRSWARFQVKES